MKVTMVNSKLTGGGAERVTCNLANHFARAGWGVELLTFDESEACEALEAGITSVSLLTVEEKSSARLLNLLRRLPRLCRYLRKQEADACVVMLPVPTILVLGLSWLTKTPIIAAERADPSRYDRLSRFCLRRLCRRAAAWVFQTETVRQWYTPCLGDVPCVVIPNAINPAFLTELQDNERQKSIVGVGRLCGQKNFGLLIRSFARIAGEFPEHRLKIYGRGGMEGELKALAETLGVADRVDFPGHVPDMPRHLQQAGMYVLSSDFEGMPNALIEAMAQGLPCVATDCGGGGARFLVEDGRNGLLVPAGDEERMAAAMRRILQDEDFARELGNAALQVRQRLAPERVYDRWLETVNAVIAAAAPHK